MTTRRTAKPPQHTHLAIRIEDHHVRISAGTNLALYGSMRYEVDDAEPVYCFATRLTLMGICFDPADRAGAPYEISLVGDHSPPRHLRSKIKDLHERDEHHAPRYKTYRGVHVPVYAEPSGLAFLDKVHGEQRWIAWVPVTPQMVSDSLLLLSGNKPVYISLHEKKIGRLRHIQGLTVQTVDPIED